MRTKTKPAEPTAVDVAEAELAAARDRLEALRASEAAANEVSRRAEAESAAAEFVDTAAPELDASRTRLVEASAAAQAALVELFAACADRTGLVDRVASELHGRGLTLEGGHETGGQRGVTSALRLRGVWHRPVNVRMLLGVLLARARGEHVGELMRGDLGVAEILDQVPAPNLPAPPRQRPWRAPSAPDRPAVPEDKLARLRREREQWVP